MAPSAEPQDTNGGLIAPKLGTVARFSKTISESDVYLYAGITGDMAPQHINEHYMAGHPFGHRVAHGTLLLGFASTVSAQLAEREGLTVVSYGYDKVRFIKPVFLGDTITATAEVVTVDMPRHYLDITITNQNDEVCAFAKHVLFHVGHDSQNTE